MTDQRTTKQNGCCHSYCDQLAEALNDAGYDFNDGLVIKLPVSFTSENVKESMFKKVMVSLYPDKTSTTQLSTVEMQAVYDNLNRFTSANWGIGLDWPNYINNGKCK